MQHIYDHAFELILCSDAPEKIQLGLTLLKDNLEKYPDSSKAHFELAGAYDYLSKEEKALVYYKKVQQMGVHTLPKADQPCFYVQYGSTLRNLKKYAQADQLFKEGLQHFPDFKALELFKALNDYSRGLDQDKNKNFLIHSLNKPTEPSILRFQKSLNTYLKLL